MAVIKDMFRYLRCPALTIAGRPFTPDRLFDLVKLLGFSFLVLLGSGIVMNIVFQLGSVSMPAPADEFTEMMNSRNFIFLAGVAAPLIEEVLFRSWLGRGWGVMLAAPLLVSVAALLVIVGAETLPLGVRGFAVISVIGAAIIYLSRYVNVRKIPGAIDKAARRVFPYAFWGSSLAFGLMHLANYQAGDMGLLLPIIVLPQFLIGVILGFVRMRFGLLSAIGFHAAYNISVLTIFTLLSQAAP